MGDDLLESIVMIENTRATCRLQCKNIRISTDILKRVFHMLTEPDLHMLVSVNRRNNDATLQCGFIIPSIYGHERMRSRFRSNMEKLATKYP